jgi:hypothetical protein
LGLGVRLTTPPVKKILLRNLKRRPRPTQGSRADDDDDDDDDDDTELLILLIIYNLVSRTGYEAPH